MKTVTFTQDIDSEYDNSYSCENHQHGLDFSGTYCLASESEAELAALRQRGEELEDDLHTLIMDRATLRVDLAEAVKLMRPVADLLQEHHKNYKNDRIVFAINRAEINVGILRKARDFLARMEVKP